MTEKRFQLKLVRVIAVIIAFITVGMIAINFVYALYSPINQTAMDASIGYGKILDNTFTSATTTLIFLGAILFALNAGTSIVAFISESAVGNVIVIVVLALLLIMNLVYLVFSIAWEWFPCNKFERNDYFNRCNSLFWCCHPDTFSNIDFMCPNFNETSGSSIACTHGRGGIISSNPAIFDPRDISTFYIVHMITLTIFILLQIIGLILSAYAIYSSPGELSTFFDTIQNLAGGAGPISNNIGTNVKGNVIRPKNSWLSGIKMLFVPPTREQIKVIMKTNKKEEEP